MRFGMSCKMRRREVPGEAEDGRHGSGVVDGRCEVGRLGAERVVGELM